MRWSPKPRRRPLRPRTDTIDAPLMNKARHQLSLALTLRAWFLATGSQWDLVQVFAWGRMLSHNLQSRTWVAAVERTFSPEGRCPLCEAVSRAKQQHENSAPISSGQAEVKIHLLCEPVPTPVVAAPEFAPHRPRYRIASSLARSAPPVPPPRG